MQDTWSQVDTYFSDVLVESDDALEAALKDSQIAQLPNIQVASNQGKLLSLLAQIHGAKHILEIGTLGGYSTIWLAKALPADGHIVTLEYEPLHAEVAQKNIERAGFSQQVEIRIGAAVDTLQVLADEGQVFDFIFIDANKEDYPTYFKQSLDVAQVGTTIFIDNVVRQGGVLDPHHEDIRVRGIRQLMDVMKTETRVDSTFLQTVGSKGYDGFILCRVVST